MFCTIIILSLSLSLSRCCSLFFSSSPRGHHSRNNPGELVVLLLHWLAWSPSQVLNNKESPRLRPLGALPPLRVASCFLFSPSWRSDIPDCKNKLLWITVAIKQAPSFEIVVVKHVQAIIKLFRVSGNFELSSASAELVKTRTWPSRISEAMHWYRLARTYIFLSWPSQGDSHANLLTN